LSDFNETSIFSTDFGKKSNMKFHINFSVGVELFYADGRMDKQAGRQKDRTGQTDKTKLTVVFRNFAKVPKRNAIRTFGKSVVIFQSIRCNISEDLNP
jgi:hypothetical protein